jgi:hypothetical protein
LAPLTAELETAGFRLQVFENAGCVSQYVLRVVEDMKDIFGVTSVFNGLGGQKQTLADSIR